MTVARTAYSAVTCEVLSSHKKASRRRLLVPSFLLKPALNNVRAVLAYPRFQHRVVPALGLNELAAMRGFVGLHLPRLASTCGACFGVHLSHTSLRIQDIDDIPQTETISRKQIAEFGLKLNLFLELSAPFQCFELC